MFKLVSSLTLFIALPLLSSTEKNVDLKNWWKNSVLYQIYPRSFMDTDGDGIGDLKGITQKLEYIKHLGVDGTWLSPIFKSPMKDFGYDVENYTDVDPIFGTMEDFHAYVNRSKELGLKVIMDFVPNHSSDQNIWFKKSELKEDPYTDYYVWADGKGENGTEPPNNWPNMFGGPGWTWSPTRKQFYYHQFLKEQPDLNFTNPLVREELKRVLYFWLENGVDGFRIDAIRHLFEDPLLRDEPPANQSTALPGEYDYFDHIYTMRYPEIYDVIAEWREVFNQFEEKDSFHRLMMVESADTIHNSLPYFGNDSFPLVDIPFNFELIWNVNKHSTGKDLYNIVTGWLDYLPETKWSNWIIGNHDQNRIANRTHLELVDAYNMICLLLRGTPITYYGEELGMVDTFISWDQIQDPYGTWFGPDRYTKYNRDPERTPMQWNSEPFSGFTKGNSTWLPVNDNYKSLNVEVQKLEPRSHLNTYRKLVSLRQQPSIAEGSIKFPIVDQNIFSFTRILKNHTSYVVAINFGNETQFVDFTKAEINDYAFPPIGTIEVMSSNLYPSLMEHSQIPINLAKIELPPRQGIVISFEPKWM